MARRTSTILTTATVASVLLLSGCIAAGEESVQIETSPETEVEPDHPDQEDGGAGGDDGAGAPGGGDSTIVIDDTTLEFAVQCTRAPGDVDVDAGTASGTAVFEAYSGEESEGSCDLTCSDL